MIQGQPGEMEDQARLSRLWHECPILQSINIINIRNVEQQPLQAQVIGEYANGSIHRRLYIIPYPNVEISIHLPRGGICPERYSAIVGGSPDTLFHSIYPSDSPSTLILYVGKLSTFQEIGFDVTEFKNRLDEIEYHGEETSENESSSSSSEEEDSDEEIEAVATRYRLARQRARANRRRES